eukprot:m.77108 g.77108  ORF g.77108 m.77108 type:complete len:196 (+) comp24978_c0_seq1:231-818(+)
MSSLAKQRLDRKTIDNFSGSSGTSSVFEKLYQNGSLHCRLTHGSVNHTLTWDTPPEKLSYDPLLVHFAMGLVETRHPLYFVARGGFKQLLEGPNAKVKAEPVAKQLIMPLRACLLSKQNEVYIAGLAALEQLAATIGPTLTPHLKMLIGQLAKNMMQAKLKERITEVFNTLETHCGEGCYKLIKAKVPVYCSVRI